MNSTSCRDLSPPKTRYSKDGRKNEWLKKNMTKDAALSSCGDVKVSLSEVKSVNSMEFLETLNLKSKEKTTKNTNSCFDSGEFLSEDNFCNSSICTYSQKIEKDSNIDDLLDTNASLTQTPLVQETKESHNSLGKTLAYSLQLIAAGDNSELLHSPSTGLEEAQEEKPKTPDKETSKGDNLIELDEDVVDCKEEYTPPLHSRYRTRSSLLHNESESNLSKAHSTEDSEVETSQNLTVNENNCSHNDKPDISLDKEPQYIPKKRGRKKKEHDACSVQKGNSFLCSQCGKSFNKRQTLRQHFITHTDRFACSFCNVRCKSKGDLRSHTQTHTKEKPYRCEVCNTCYTRESILKKHKLTQLHKNACFQLGNQIHLALKGDISFNEGRDLKDGKFTCSSCPKKFVSKQLLRHHMKVHNYKFSCPQCHKRCKNAYLLKVHKRCHLKLDVISCKFCSRGFSNLRLLREHIKAAHSSLFWQSKFPGNMWKTLFAQKVECFDDLKLEFFQSMNSMGTLVCPVCSRNFKSKKAFQKHCLKHEVNNCQSSSSEKNLDPSTGKQISQYQCAECSKSFVLFEDFCKHHTELHSTKPMTCHICYNQFESAVDFRSHVQNHGPTMLFSGASLEETKIPHVRKRYRRNSASQYDLMLKEPNERNEDKINTNALHEESDDERFLENLDFLGIVSDVYDDSPDKEDSSDDDEEIYTGLKMLLCDDSQSPGSLTCEKEAKIASVEIFEKYETDMRIFSVEDDENNFFKCNLCDVIFVTSSLLQDHMRSHVCVSCNIFCQSKEDIKEHLHCDKKGSLKNSMETTNFHGMLEMRSDDETFCSDDEMNEVFLDELEAILDNESKMTPSVDFLSTFSHDEIIRTNKKIFERYSCIDIPTNIYACIICKRKYARPTTLTRHFKTHVCHYCNTFFVDKSDLTDHKYKHRKKAALIKAEISGEASAKVLHSPLVSKVNRELFKKFTVIDPSRNMNKCCLCDKLFVRKTVLTRHMKTHICSFCDKFFEDKYELARHVNLHKMDSRISEEDTGTHRQFPVYDEEKPFISTPAFSNQLDGNEKMVNMGSSYSTTLPQFTATFSTPNTNSNETVTFIQIPVSEACTDHSTVPFDPNVVADAPTYQIISDPIVQSQGSYIVGPQNCHDGSSSKMLTIPQDHMVAPDQCQVGTADLFDCNLRSKSFFKNGHLKPHLSTHTAPAPFACRFCGKTFIRRGPLRKHEKTHDAKRCEHCDLSFTCQFELDHHMQIHESYPFYK